MINKHNYNQSINPLLTFENIWMYGSNRPILMDPSISDVSINADVQKTNRNNAPAYYKKWLTSIKCRLSANKPVTNKSIASHKKLLLSDVSGTLLPGQITVLTGYSGSGKSVLLRVLAGLSPMFIGDVWFYNNNKKPSGIHNTPATQWRAQVALLAQHPQLIEGSVLDNLQMPYHLRTYQQSHFDIDWHIEQLAYLERTADFLQQSASHLSGGERQLVNTLRLLQLAPQVLLLDEPTAALDPDTSAKLVQLLINWLHADPQRTLLWVTHDTQDIMPLANHHWHMQAGVLTEVF